MRKMLKFELHRAFHHKFFLIALLIGTVIAVSHVFQNVLPMYKYLLSTAADGLYPHSVFDKWIGGEGHSLQPMLFYLLFPLIAVLPFADSYFSDVQTGYMKNICTRTEKKNYCIAKYCATFISAGFVIVFPLVLNLILTACILPSVPPDPVAGTYGIWEFTTMGSIFLRFPYLYVLIYLLIDFIFGGLFACLSLVASFFVSNKFIVLLVPFVSYLFMYAVFGNSMWNPAIFLSPFSRMNVTIPLWIMGGILFILTTVVFFYQSNRNEIL